MDDYLEYFDDFEQESGETSQKHSAAVELKTPKARDLKSKPKKFKMAGNSPKDRLLSSKEHEIRELQNKLAVISKQLQETEKENKTLRRLQIRQERELNKISAQEGELPTILQKHNNEVRSLRQQLRQSQSNNLELKKKQTELGEELWRVNVRRKKLEDVSKRKGLMEREHLMIELQDTHDTIRGKDERIQELEKSIELTKKAHSQEVKSLLTRQKQLIRQMTDTRHDMVQYRQQLKEKERLLDVTNIYSQRVPPTSYVSIVPNMDDKHTQTSLTCSPGQGEMIMNRKYQSNTTDTQTDSHWNTFISPKHNDSTDKPTVHAPSAITMITTVSMATNPITAMTTSMGAYFLPTQSTVTGSIVFNTDKVSNPSESPVASGNATSKDTNTVSVIGSIFKDDGPKHSTKRGKSDLLSQLFDTTDNQSTSISDHEASVGNTKQNSSTSSLLSKSERIKNMHQGLPSMASDDDPYGAKKKRDTSGGGVVNKGPAKHGRRAMESVGTNNGLIFGDTQQNRFGSNEGGDNGLLIGGVANLSSNNKQSTGGYSWEQQVDIHSNTRRNTFQIDDDLEELTIN